MKNKPKIIVAIDGLKYTSSATEYAIQISLRSNAYLAGIFLDDFTYHSHMLTGLNYEQLVKEKKELNAADQQAREDAVAQFERSCSAAGLNYSVHHDCSLAAQELLHESVYADLLIIGKKETFNQYEHDIPTTFVQNMLANAECPVLVVPQEYKPVNKIILLYDGTPSSVYAIKLFSCLSAAWSQLPVNVVSVKAPGLSRHLPEHRFMKELMKRHFDAVEYTILAGEPEEEIIKYLKYRRQDELVVLGAYRRSTVSRWFKPSMADRLLAELKTPVFVAHR